MKRKILAALLGLALAVGNALPALAESPDDVIFKWDEDSSKRVGFGFNNGEYAVWHTPLFKRMFEEADANTDGTITWAEAQAVTEMNLSGLGDGVSSFAGIQNFPNLKRLDVSGSGIEDARFFGALGQLEELVLSDCPNFKNVATLPNLASLKVLNLSGTAVGELTELPAFTSLEKLDLSDCENLADIGKLPNLASLKTLDISGTGVRDLSVLPTLSGLTSLSAAGNRIQEIAPLATRTGLQYLDLSDNAIEVVPNLQGLTQLTTLKLTENKIKDKGMLQTNVPGGVATAEWLAEVLGEPDDPDAPAVVDKDALDMSIFNAKDQAGSVTVSADGADVPSAKQWVTAGVMATLQSAIDAAQAVFDKADATQPEVDAAATTLRGAITTFVAAKQPGTSAVDTARLDAVIAAAEVLLNETLESVNGSNVPADQRWATTANRQAYAAAIAAAKATLGADNQVAIDNARAALEQATTTYNGQLAAGRQATPAPTPSGGNDSDSGDSGTVNGYLTTSGAAKAPVGGSDASANVPNPSTGAPAGSAMVLVGLLGAAAWCLRSRR